MSDPDRGRSDENPSCSEAYDAAAIASPALSDDRRRTDPEYVEGVVGGSWDPVRVTVGMVMAIIKVAKGQYDSEGVK